MTQCEIRECDREPDVLIEGRCPLHYVASIHNRERFAEAVDDIYAHNQQTQQIAVDPETEEPLYQCLGCGQMVTGSDERTCGCPVGVENAFALGDYERGEDYVMKAVER